MKKRKTILYQLRLLIFVSFAIFFVLVAFILGIQYRRSTMRSIRTQMKYEDNILAQSLENDIQNTNNSVNSVIITLNEVLSDEELNNGEGPIVNPNIQRKVYESMINTFTSYSNAQQILIVWNNGVNWYES